MRLSSLTIVASAVAVRSACDSQPERPPSREGTVDTLSWGQVVVRNLGEGVRRSGEEWRIEEEVRIGLPRSDLSFSSADTVEAPRDPVERASLTGMEGRIIATVPFQGGLIWRLTPSGTPLAVVSDEYRIFELNREEDTIRTITRAFTPLPVTSADHEYARENMRWFTDQGGVFNVSSLPRVKPATRGFFLAEDGHVWVARVTADGTNRTYDIFAPDGRLLGEVEFPFTLRTAPFPIVRGDFLHGVVRDELDVAYVVRARIRRP